MKKNEENKETRCDYIKLMKCILQYIGVKLML